MLRTAVADQPDKRKRRTSGIEIRARIEANARKRRSIAEQMKREAGVRAHLENRTELSGLAWTNTGCIETPESRNIANLYVLAHECGHVFLHMTGVGRILPSHVMEYEAECYAHQALRHHGMTVPPMHTAQARRYVTAMMDQDRAQRLPISPAAERFASGAGSPFAPLRDHPKSWRDPRPAATLHDLYPDYVVRALRNIEAEQADKDAEIKQAHFNKVYVLPILAVSLSTGLLTGSPYWPLDHPLVAGALALYLAGRASIDWVDRIIARRKAVTKFLSERDRPVTSHVQLATDGNGRPILKQVRDAP